MAPPRFELPAEIIVRIVTMPNCSAPKIIAMSSTCQGWHAALHDESELLWRIAALGRFPRLAAIVAAVPTTEPWLEIYKIQYRSEQNALSSAVQTPCRHWHLPLPRRPL